MTWTRVGDTAATHPGLRGVVALAPEEPDAVLALAGFMLFLYTNSGAHLTDYVVDYGVVQMMGGARWEAHLGRAERLGLIERVEVDGLPMVRLLEDPGFMHILRREEVMVRQNQQRDNKRPELTAVVRYRDGDTCRWCGTRVRWSGPKSGNLATYDHLYPERLREGRHDSTADELLIACHRCNSSRGANPLAFHEQYPAPLPVPSERYYSKSTAEYISRHSSYSVEPTYPDARRSRSLAPEASSVRAAELEPVAGTSAPLAASEGARDAAVPASIPAPSGVAAIRTAPSVPAATAASSRERESGSTGAVGVPPDCLPSSDVDASRPRARAPREVGVRESSRTPGAENSNFPGRDGMGLDGSGGERAGTGRAGPGRRRRGRRGRGRRQPPPGS